MLGDSVMNGMAQGYSTAARALLAKKHTFILDTAGCRRLIGYSCHIGTRPAPTTALQELRANAGKFNKVIVVAAGYNDRPDIAEGLATLYLKYKAAKVPAELHIFADGGHGERCWGYGHMSLGSMANFYKIAARHKALDAAADAFVALDMMFEFNFPAQSQ